MTSSVGRKVFRFHLNFILGIDRSSQVAVAVAIIASVAIGDVVVVQIGSDWTVPNQIIICNFLLILLLVGSKLVDDSFESAVVVLV